MKAARYVWLAALGLTAAAPWPVGTDTQTRAAAPIEIGAPRPVTAAVLAQRAAGLEARSRADGGRARLYARLDAIDAWRDLRCRFPRAPEAASGALRAGRMLGALEFADEAREAFAHAALHLPRPEVHVAELERGHLERRVGRHVAALDAYARVERDPFAPRSARDTAGLWSGRVFAARGSLEDAVRVWGALLNTAADPVDRIRAGDWLALGAIARADFGAAAQWIVRTREVSAEVALERTPEGVRVRRALARMRSIVELGLAREDGPPTPDTLFDAEVAHAQEVAGD